MLHREDKKKVPVAFIPNGSGNDLCAAFLINSIDRALDYIVKGDLFKMDVCKVVIDYEKEEDIPKIDKTSNLRYQLINSNFSCPAKIAHSAIYYKKCCGAKAYDIAAIGEFCKLKEGVYDLYINKDLYLEDIKTTLVMGFNGKYGGGGMVLNPFALINDGFTDMVVIPEKFGFGQMVDFLGKATKKGGVQGYDNRVHHLRAKTFKLVNKNKPKKKN